MKIITTCQALKDEIKAAKAKGQTIGLVPTMGYLHEGHLTLMRQAKAQNDVVVASIFVNPIQFGPGEDYAVYPRDLERDAKLAETAAVDYIFAPTAEEMYPQGYENMLTFVEVQKITTGLCGATRPGHFRGVATVVTKLMNLVQPDRAYFGQKDAQQVAVLRQMVQDLNMNVTLVPVPIVREEDGLALSSRNIYLSPVERQAALVLSQALKLAEKALFAGERKSEVIRQQMKELIEAEPLAQIDYLTICDALSLEEVEKVEGQILIAMAVRIGKTRLIDNLLWQQGGQACFAQS